MLKHTRALAATAIGAVVIATSVVVAPAAVAAPAANSPTDNAARWLTNQLTDGIVHNTQFDFDDVGLSLDIYFALQRLNLGPESRAQILQAVAGRASDYVQYETPTTTYYYPASAAKLATAVELGGGDPTSVDGIDLIAMIEGKTDDATGITTGVSGGVAQAWVTRALVLAGSDEADRSLTYLLTQQCPDGGFKQIYGSECPEDLSVDATAFAVQVLLDAQNEAVGNAAEALTAVGAALAAGQQSDGSYLNDGVANTNSTGLAASALSDLGRSAASLSAARWVAGKQVTDAAAAGTPLTTDTGAIAYSDSAFTNGRAEGLTTESRDQWQRASAQAAPALSVLPGGTARVSPLAPFSPAGGAVSLSITGLEPGWRVTVAGAARGSAIAASGGRATVPLRLPAGTARRSVTVSDSRGVVVGTSSTTALAGRGFWVKAGKSKVKRSKYQSVRASGLAAREPVRVYYRGRLVKRGTASATGTYYYKFKVGKKKGRATVSVYGAFNNRKGSKTFRVVK